MKKTIIWTIRILTLAAAVMMVVSFIQPWWTCKFSETTGINIYGWGLRHNVFEYASYIESDITPIWQTVLAWTYIAVSVAIMLWSTFVKWSKAICLQGIVGVGYIAYALVAMYFVIANRTSDFDITLQGESIPKGAAIIELVVRSSIQPGFYLALATGGFIVLLAIIQFVLAKEKANYHTMFEFNKKHCHH